eukprot:11063-Heterococcus_DN1.PRE.3
MAAAVSAGQRLAAADAALAAQRTGAGDRLAEERHLARIQHPSTATAAAAVKQAANAAAATGAMSSCWKRQNGGALSATTAAATANASAGAMTAEAERCSEVRVRYADYNGCYDTLDKLYHSQESKCLVSLHPNSMQQELLNTLRHVHARALTPLCAVVSADDHKADTHSAAALASLTVPVPTHSAACSSIDAVCSTMWASRSQMCSLQDAMHCSDSGVCAMYMSLNAAGSA